MIHVDPFRQGLTLGQVNKINSAHPRKHTRPLPGWTKQYGFSVPGYLGLGICGFGVFLPPPFFLF